jgi:hypothetical protein
MSYRLSIPTMVAAVALASVPSIAAVEGPLPNGTFAAGQPPWSMHSERDARATWEVETVDGNAVAVIEVTATGKSNHVQFACPFPSAALGEARVYELSFRCRASSARTIRVVLLERGKPWGSAGLGENVRVGTTWQTFSFVFRNKPVKQDMVKLDFFLGANLGKVWLDDVVLTPLRNGERPPVARQVNSGDSELGLGADGAVVSLRHTPSGVDLVGPAAATPAFLLGLRRGGETMTRSSREAAEITPRDGAPAAYAAEYPDMTVRFSYEPAARRGLFDCRIAIDNRGDWAIETVTFPVLDCPDTLGATSEDDRLLYPRFDGGLVENPRLAMVAAGATGLYPGLLSCQVMSLFDPAAGLYMACHDATGEVKRFDAKLMLNLRLSIDHLRPLLPGRDVVVPYPVVIGTFPGGTWHEAASIYRDWALAQDWLPTPLWRNERVPTWLRKGGVVDFHVPYVKGRPRTDAELRERLATISGATGLPVLAINWGWERYGMWCSQEYFPPRPSDEAFRRHGAISGEQGAGMTMLSGYRWTFERQLTDGSLYSSRERFDREVRPWVTCAEEPAVPTIKAGKPTHYKGSGYAQMCPATDYAIDTVVAVAKRCVESGYPAVHFDQPPGNPYCLATNHGHPPGYGRWQHEAMARLYARIREVCAPLDPAFVLSMEEPRELYLRECQLIQSRPNGLVPTFPMCRPFTRVVPLFLFLYHDYQIGWSSAYPARSNGHVPHALAKGYAAGLMPGLVWDWFTQIQPDTRREEALTMLGNCSRLYRKEGLDFLLYGRMLKPLHLDVPQRLLELGKQPSLRVPAVTHSVWQAPDGRVAALFFNPERQAHTIRLPDGRSITVPPLDATLIALPEGKNERDR